MPAPMRPPAWMTRPGGPARSLLATVVPILVLVAVVAMLLAACTESGGAGPGGSDGSAEPTEASSPDEPTGEPTPVATPSRLVELRKAVAAGEVRVRGYGVGLERLDIEITDLTAEALRVVVHPGTVFDAGRAKVQAMVVTTKQVIAVDPGGSERTTLDAACTQMHLDQPGVADRFLLETEAIPADLRKLVNAEGFADEDFRVRQFAIWTITDDPTPGGFVGLGITAVGSGPTDDEIAAIRKLFTTAGIDPGAYRATR
jgi:hypothetical protein